jgi:hypothetical protein
MGYRGLRLTTDRKASVLDKAVKYIDVNGKNESCHRALQYSMADYASEGYFSNRIASIFKTHNFPEYTHQNARKRFHAFSRAEIAAERIKLEKSIEYRLGSKQEKEQMMSKIVYRAGGVEFGCRWWPQTGEGNIQRIRFLEWIRDIYIEKCMEELK